MELTLRISDNWMELLKIIGGFILFCVITIYGGKYYLNRQKREEEEAQRMIDEMNARNGDDDAMGNDEE